ncbi:MAG: HDOD domain-containing protein [Planctomycetes bacterium]|nr:HDOD domain-containing protein [Planctomycetota bacterium]
MSQPAIAQPAGQPASGRDLARLSYAQLPVLAASKTALQELGSRVTLNTTRVADIVLADPGLALQLLREANVQAVKRRELEVAGISHAVLLLGMEQTLDFVAHLRTADSIRPRRRREGLMHASARAAHAGALARRWTQARGDSVSETAACAAITRHAAELVLWSGDVDAVTLFAQLNAAGADRPARETELLGCTLQELGERLAADGAIPSALRAALDDTGALQQRVLPSVLASALAEAAARDWNDARTLQLVALFGDLHGLDEDRAAARVHATTADIARASPFGADLSAARYLLLAPGDRFEPEELEPPVESAAPPAPAAPERTSTAVRPGPEPAAPEPGTGEERARRTPAEQPVAARTTGSPVAANPGADQVPAAGADAETVFRGCVMKLAEVRRGQLTVQQALPGVVDGLREGLGFDRAVFALRNRDKPLLEARYTSGDPRQPALEVDLTKANLISRLMQSPQGVWLHEGTRERLWPYLPRTLRGYVGERSFCAMSLFVRDRAVGLLYADYRGSGIDEKGYARFKRVAAELSAALSTRAASRA